VSADIEGVRYCSNAHFRDDFFDEELDKPETEPAHASIRNPPKWDILISCRGYADWLVSRVARTSKELFGTQFVHTNQIK
jgi:hypothetical protein